MYIRRVILHVKAASHIPIKPIIVKSLRPKGIEYIVPPPSRMSIFLADCVAFATNENKSGFRRLYHQHSQELLVGAEYYKI